MAHLVMKDESKTSSFFHSEIQSQSRMNFLLWWLLAIHVGSFSVRADTDHLSDFLVGVGSEQHVQRIRDVLDQRLRCGSQTEVSKSLCRECLSAKRIFNITRRTGSGNDTLVQELSRVSVVLLNYLLTFQTSCTVESVRLGYVGSCRVYDQCLSEMSSYLSSLKSKESPEESLDALEKILRKVKAVFEPEPSKQCFSAEILLNEVDITSKKLEGLSRDITTVVLLMSHLYSGECIDVGESVADFLDDIFLHYGDGCERVMTQSGFTKLWNDLQMQRKGKHIDHGVQKNTCFSGVTAHPEKQASASTTYKFKDTPKTDITNGNTASTSISFSESEDQSGFPTTNGQPTDTDSTSVVLIPPVKNSKNASIELVHPQNSDVYHLDDNDTMKTATSKRAVRHMPFPSDHEHKNLANECLPSDDLLQRFLTPGNEMITSSEFLQLCPALVQQAVSGVCTARLKATVLANKTVEVFQEETFQSTSPWLAVLAVSIITAISLLGLFLLPVLKKSFFVHINAFFTGLAFGTMSGDVVLHIMPQYLKLHQHDSHGHDHDTETTLERLFPSYLQRQLAFLLTMYLLFLVECIFSAMTGEKKEHHGHSHGPVDISMNDLALSGDVENGEIKPKLSYCSRITEFLKPSNLFSGISSKAAVIVLADTVHNFADGMAIAVGFSMSYKDGLSTSVAVFFHELPHEIGDFAILMNCGLSYWKAFVFNILSGLSAFLGLAVGVFTASMFREWLLCITAGLFFFVVMGEMLPDMRLESKKMWREFVVKITGTVLGIITMICIAMYELSAS